MRARTRRLMEPISPELCLVDPVLARRARELLSPLEDVEPALSPAPAAALRVEAAPRGRLTRLGVWLLVPSVVLNAALLWPRSDSSPVVAASPALPAARPPAKHPAAPKPRTGGVLGAKTKPRRAVDPPVTVPRAQSRRLSWPATPSATSYDLVLWRGHRRVADLWPKKPGIDVAKVACGAGRRLKKGRYLWFAYPVVGSHRYGKLARWGAVDIDPKTCPRT
jgi:hypothetical protein